MTRSINTTRASLIAAGVIKPGPAEHAQRVIRTTRDYITQDEKELRTKGRHACELIERNLTLRALEDAAAHAANTLPAHASI
jgi:hypothetical protein